MNTYTKRACHSCGIRKIQPEMHQKEMYVETGKSKAGVSGATFFGSASGDKKSQRAVNNWLFNSGQRTYLRKRKVWLCGSCVKTVKLKNDDTNIGAIILFAIFAIMIIASLGTDTSDGAKSTDNKIRTVTTQ